MNAIVPISKKKSNLDVHFAALHKFIIQPYRSNIRIVCNRFEVTISFLACHNNKILYALSSYNNSKKVSFVLCPIVIFFLASRYHVEIDDNESKLCQRLQSFQAKLNVSVNSNKLIWISTWMRRVLRVFVVSLPTFHLLQWLSMKYYKIEFVENPKKGWR